MPWPARGLVTKPLTFTSPLLPDTGSRDRANSRPSAAYTAGSSSPFPGVCSTSAPSRSSLKDTSGWLSASCVTTAEAAAPSALSFFMNFIRAGVL